MSKDAPDVNAEIARVMRVARMLSGMTLRAYARHLDMSSATLCRIEAGKGCDLATLAHIKAKTGISYSVLLGEVRG